MALRRNLMLDEALTHPSNLLLRIPRSFHDDPSDPEPAHLCARIMPRERLYPLFIPLILHTNATISVTQAVDDPETSLSFGYRKLAMRS